MVKCNVVGLPELCPSRLFEEAAESAQEFPVDARMDATSWTAVRASWMAGAFISAAGGRGTANPEIRWFLPTAPPTLVV